MIGNPEEIRNNPQGNSVVTLSEYPVMREL
jgi:hypothetical protein